MEHVWNRVLDRYLEDGYFQWKCSSCGCLAIRRDDEKPELIGLTEFKDPAIFGWWPGEVPSCDLMQVMRVLHD